MCWILQEELYAVPQESEVFSSFLLEAEQLNRVKQDLDQVENKLNMSSYYTSQYVYLLKLAIFTLFLSYWFRQPWI